MSHIASALFFTAVLAAAIIFAIAFIRENLGRIVGALRGELPSRIGHQPWPGSRVRVTVRYRPAAPVVRSRRHARA